MIWLVVGVLLWSGAHFVPCAGLAVRSQLIARLGELAYRGVFALTLIGAIVAMVLGWRSSPPVAVYLPPAWGAAGTNLLMLVALVLFAASVLPTNLRRVIRHPQLTGFALWAGAHLLSNGEARSLVLFGGLGLWAVSAMLLLDRRDGAWVKPAAQPLGAELKLLLAAAVAFAALFFAHAHVLGVSPMPR